MALLDYLYAANDAPLAEYVPFYHQHQQIGLLWQAHLPLLQDNGLKLLAYQGGYQWQSGQNTEENSHILANVFAQLRQQGLFKDWRDELFALSANHLSPPIALIERATLPILGACGYGVHVNGLVWQHQRWNMWLSKRSANKVNYPNQLDQIAAGGINYGDHWFLQMQRECAEEAGIDASLSAQAHQVSVCSYCHQSASGLRADVMLNYDLILPPEFVPKNVDGEVSDFYLYEFEEVLQILRESQTIKFNSALSLIDCLIRYGYIDANQPEYLTLSTYLNHRAYTLALHAQAAKQGMRINPLSALLA